MQQWNTDNQGEYKAFFKYSSLLSLNFSKMKSLKSLLHWNKMALFLELVSKTVWPKKDEWAEMKQRGQQHG